MAAAAQPTPAELPLPGGTAGATVRVHPLKTGEILLPPRALDRPTGRLAGLRRHGLHTPRSRWGWVPVPAFLVEHPTAGRLLVDTGLHASVAADPVISLGRRQTRLLPVRAGAQESATAQLRARGIAAQEIGTIVMTHLHNDHASAVTEFPGATFVVTSIEWTVAARSGFAQGYRREHYMHPFDWRLVDPAAPGTRGYGAFNRCADLFGDGSVRLLFTPGHTRGHQSVLLRLSHARELLLTGDAAYARRSIDEDLVPIYCADEHLYRGSLRQIREYLDATPGAHVICGHDAERWPQLETLYA